MYSQCVLLIPVIDRIVLLTVFSICILIIPGIDKISSTSYLQLFTVYYQYVLYVFQILSVYRQHRVDIIKEYTQRANGASNVTERINIRHVNVVPAE